MDDPGEWVRATTSLVIVDYAASMSNSEIQGAYTLSRRALLALKVSDFTSVQLFVDTKLEKHSVFLTYAINAQRSDIDLLDRGSQDATKPTVRAAQGTRRLQYSRRRSVSQNCVDRDWVVDELSRLESREARSSCTQLLEATAPAHAV